MLLRRSPVWWHRPESILTKPSSSSWQAWATGNEETVGEEEERGGEGPPSPALVLLFLPHFSFFTSQECKSLKPPDLRRGNQWRWCRDLNADPPCVSHRQQPHLPPPLSPPFLPPSEGLLVHRCSRTDVVSVHFLFVFYCVLNEWGAELCFTWSLNPSQIKPCCVCGPSILNVCSLKATEWVTGLVFSVWRASDGRPSLHISNIDRPPCFYLACPDSVLWGGLSPLR